MRSSRVTLWTTEVASYTPVETPLTVTSTETTAMEEPHRANGQTAAKD